MGKRSFHILHESISRGLAFILRKQGADGSWTDWALPPGSATPWTTAYVGWQLRTLPPELGQGTHARINAAAGWLLDNVFDDGGWGYNRDTGSDADTTAHAILFLTSLGREVPDQIYTHLCTYQTADGGFATYLTDGIPSSWTVSHLEVTAVALLALASKPLQYQQQIKSGLAFILEQQREDGMWNSFWWHTSLYATNASLTLLEAIECHDYKSLTWQSCKPTNSFEKALLVSIMHKLTGNPPREAANELVAQLVVDQQHDGSWPSVPILRVTHRNCYTPWAESDSGPLYRDRHRLFTTATMTSALSLWSTLIHPQEWIR